MNKESMLFRTHEIKSNLLTKLNDPVECLFFHIKDNNYQKFKEILEKYKISVDSMDSDGNTFLNLAVQCNSSNIAEYLLNLGAEVNTQNVF
jgi:ankyrin repeat protein